MVTCDNEYSYKRLVYNVSLLGGTYNQNCLNQAHDTDKLAPFRKKALTNEKEHARDFDLNLCIEFFGIENNDSQKTELSNKKKRNPKVKKTPMLTESRVAPPITASSERTVKQNDPSVHN